MLCQTAKEALADLQQQQVRVEASCAGIEQRVTRQKEIRAQLLRERKQYEDESTRLEAETTVCLFVCTASAQRVWQTITRMRLHDTTRRFKKTSNVSCEFHIRVWTVNAPHKLFHARDLATPRTNEWLASPRSSPTTTSACVKSTPGGDRNPALQAMARLVVRMSQRAPLQGIFKHLRLCIRRPPRPSPTTQPRTRPSLTKFAGTWWCQRGCAVRPPMFTHCCACAPRFVPHSSLKLHALQKIREDVEFYNSHTKPLPSLMCAACAPVVAARLENVAPPAETVAKVDAHM